MAPSPTDIADSSAVREYANSWQATLHLVRSGHSWSGRERNCAYLNTPLRSSSPSTTPRFVNVSAITGLDFPDDGRAVAVVDWDGDGDLDLWFRNRSAPRLRLLLNQSEQMDSEYSAVCLQLLGTKSNSQAIGARAEMFLKSAADGRRHVRTVRVGDAFLSQSSTDLHFGFHRSEQIEKVELRWPSGEKETILNLTAGTYEVVEGSGKAKPVRARRSVAMPPGVLEPQGSTVAGRVILPGRVPMPPIDLTDFQGNGVDRQSSPTLFVFWSSTCPNCRQELEDLATHKSKVQAAGLSVTAVCLDGLDTGQPENDMQARRDAEAFVRGIDIPYQVVTTSKESLDLLADFQRALFDTPPQFAIPLSLLADANGNLVGIYRGAFSHTTFVRDREILNFNDKQLRALSAPLGGRWITEPASHAQFSQFIGERIVNSHPAAALNYFEFAASVEVDPVVTQAIQERIRHLRSQPVQTD